MKRCVLLFVAALAFPAALQAQADTAFYSRRAPNWATHFSMASANALISGLTAGLQQELKGGSFRDGFTRGALGGLLIYGGKRVTAEHFSGAGFLGREVGAIGASMVHNASMGIGTFERVVLPVGITRVYWQRGANPGWQIKLDAVALGWTLYGIIEPELDFNAERTLSSGTPVFETNGKIIAFDDNAHAGGTVQTSVLFLSDVKQWGDEFLARTYAHERVHVNQLDQVFLTLNEPYDDWLLQKAPFGRQINRWIDINLSTEFVHLLSRAFDNHGDRPWELEAIYLTR
jgi:hypothetical protein